MNLRLGEEELRILRLLDTLVKQESVRSVIDPIVSGVERKLVQEHDALLAWEPMPLTAYGGGLPDMICSSWVFVLRAGAITGAELHPNSHQRVMSYRGAGDLQVWVDGRWHSNPLTSDPHAPLESRWASIPVNAWHQGVVPGENWVVVSFHTVVDDELIEERPDPADPGLTHQRKYLAKGAKGAVASGIPRTKGRGAMKIETLAVHAGHRVDPSSGALSAPICLSTTFEREADGSYPHGFIYSRSGNPGRAALEQCLAALEGGAACAAFSSGSAATMAVFHALSPGDHVVAPTDVYYGTALLLRETFARWGLEVTFVDMTDLGQVEQALRPNTKLVWTETPSNPLLKITDLGQVSRLTRKAGALCACDNTWATPVLQRPLDLGVDVVMHATTKYLGGHSDVVSGAVVSRVEDTPFQRIRKLQTSGGAVPSPFDSWLVLRGIRTLPYRMRAHSENAMQVAAFLSEHPRVEAVHYPGLKGHPGHDIATRQMALFGGMLSFQVHGGKEEAMAVAANVKLFTRATSLGGVESLIEHRASIEGSETRTPQNLLRLSIGLEHPDDLIDDLAQALE